MRTWLTYISRQGQSISWQSQSLTLVFGGQRASHKTISLLIGRNLIGNKSAVCACSLGVEIIDSCYDDKQQRRPDAETATARFRRHGKAVSSSQTISFRFLAKCHSLLPLGNTMTFLKAKTTKLKTFGETSFQKIFNLGKTHPLNRIEKRLTQHA